MKLYFLAILSDADLREQVKNLKEEVRERYGVKHALKLPAHITLEPPFKIPEEEASHLMEKLGIFAKQQTSFSVNLNGFGSFPPRVIFIKVENHRPLVYLHEQLRGVMQNFVASDKLGKPSSFHPHITIATRDVDKRIFKAIWREFKNRELKAGFKAESMVLFKHNGKTWDLHKEFFFEA